MVMNWQSAALGAAGAIGCGVAVIHGILTERLMVRRFKQISEKLMSASARWLIPALLQFSTFNWFLGGLALIAAIWLPPVARLAIGLLVGSSYLFGAVGNFWATRGRHPGWALYAVALVLIGFGVSKSGG
jgi:hypothetical protein